MRLISPAHRAHFIPFLSFTSVSATIPTTSASSFFPPRDQRSPGQTHCFTAVPLNKALKLPGSLLFRLNAVTVIRTAQ